MASNKKTKKTKNKSEEKINLSNDLLVDQDADMSSYGSDYFVPSNVNQVYSDLSHGSAIQIRYPKCPEDLNLDKLFGFSRAQQKFLKLENEENEDETEDILSEKAKPQACYNFDNLFKLNVSSFVGVKPNKVFINRVDSYFGKYFVQYLQDQKYSSQFEVQDTSRTEQEQDVSNESLEDEDEEESGNLSESGENSYENIIFNESMSFDDEDPFNFLSLSDEDSGDESFRMKGKFLLNEESFSNKNLIKLGKINLKKVNHFEYNELLDTHSSSNSRVKSIINRFNDDKPKSRTTNKVNIEVPFEIIGTLRNKDINMNEPKNKYLQNVQIIDSFTEDRNKFLETIMQCAIVIYNLAPCEVDQTEEATWTVHAITRISQDMYQEKYTTQIKRTFILISPVMTWTNSLPFEFDNDSDALGLSFEEEDYKRRYPHENYKKLYRTENEVICCGKGHKKYIKTLVINTGIMYGYEEDVLEYLFRQTWQCEIDTPVLGDGQNLVPLIHVNDLSAIVHKCIVQNISDIQVPLMFAFEPNILSQIEICKAISLLGKGRIEKTQKELAWTIPGTEITQISYDQLTSNLNLSLRYLTENLFPGFHTSFIENIDSILNEYIVTNNLQPYLICITGPPLTGKTSIALQLSEHFNIFYLNESSIVNIYKELLIRRERELKIRNKKNNDLNQDDNSSTGDERENEEGDKDEQKKIQSDLSELKKQIFEDNVNANAILGELLTFKIIKNKGFILDNVPNTRDELNKVFKDQSTQPNLLINLKADESVILKRIYDLPQEYFNQYGYKDKELIDKLLEFKNDSENYLSYFIENKIKIIDVNSNRENPRIAFLNLTYKLGKPKDKTFFSNFLQINDKSKYIKKAEADSKQTDEDRSVEDKKETRLKKMEEWREKEILARENEEAVLDMYVAPLRNELQEQFLSQLNKGLLDVIPIKSDPIDFIATQVFKNTIQDSNRFNSIENNQLFIQMQEELVNKTKNLLKKSSML